MRGLSGRPSEPCAICFILTRSLCSVCFIFWLVWGRGTHCSRARTGRCKEPQKRLFCFFFKKEPILVFLACLPVQEAGREAAGSWIRRRFSEQTEGSAWKLSQEETLDADRLGPVCHTSIGRCTFVYCFSLFFLCPALFMCNWFGFQVIVSVLRLGACEHPHPK